MASEFSPPNSNFHSKAQVLSATKIVSCFPLCDRVTLFVKKMSAKYLHLNNYTLIGILSSTKLHSMGGEKREQLVYLTTQTSVEDCLLQKITVLLWYTAEMLSVQLPLKPTPVGHWLSPCECAGPKDTATTGMPGATASIRAEAPAVLRPFAFVPLAQMSTQQKGN